MSEIEQYRDRIQKALGRITSAASDLIATQPDPALAVDSSALQAALAQANLDLDAEKATTARMREQVQAQEELAQAQEERAQAQDEQAQAKLVQTEMALTDQAQTETQSLGKKNKKLRKKNEHLEAELERLKESNEKLHTSNSHLRTELESHHNEGATIIESLNAELDALKVTRANDISEMGDILDELKPLLEGHVDA